MAAHPYLLSTIVMEEGEPCMSTPEESSWKTPVIEVGSIEEARKGFCATMDLNAGKPLFRLEIYKTLPWLQLGSDITRVHGYDLRYAQDSWIPAVIVLKR